MIITGFCKGSHALVSILYCSKPVSDIDSIMFARFKLHCAMDLGWHLLLEDTSVHVFWIDCWLLLIIVAVAVISRTNKEIIKKL